jgi:hypothetical protein
MIMIKMRIIMDEAKINREGLYSSFTIQQLLDDAVANVGGFKKNLDGYYSYDGVNGAAKAAGILYFLSDSDWFIENVKTWLYFRENLLGEPGDYFREDWKSKLYKRLGMAS